MENCLEKVRCKRQFFWKFFLVSFVIFIFSYLLVSAMQGCCYMSKFGMNPWFYQKILINAFAIWKILVIQFTLIPTIVLLWIEKDLEKQQQKD